MIYGPCVSASVKVWRGLNIVRHRIIILEVLVVFVWHKRYGKLICEISIFSCVKSTRLLGLACCLSLFRAALLVLYRFKRQSQHSKERSGHLFAFIDLSSQTDLSKMFCCMHACTWHMTACQHVKLVLTGEPVAWAKDSARPLSKPRAVQNALVWSKDGTECPCLNQERYRMPLSEPWTVQNAHVGTKEVYSSLFGPLPDSKGKWANATTLVGSHLDVMYHT